jgi:group I intron endonuclease
MFIYLILNTSNGKMYVGKTLLPPVKRWQQHIYRSGTKRRTNMPLHSAIRKYGPETFRVVELRKANSIQELNELERLYIRLLHTNTHGYNATSGGDGGDTFSRNPRREEIRIGMRDRNAEHARTLWKFRKKVGSNPRVGSDHTNWKEIPKSLLEKLILSGLCIRLIAKETDASEKAITLRIYRFWGEKNITSLRYTWGVSQPHCGSFKERK